MNTQQAITADSNGAPHSSSAKVRLDKDATSWKSRLANPPVNEMLELARAENRAKSRDIATWPDDRLVAAVRSENPDEAALEVLVNRYWKTLFGRCQLLVLDPQKASDLAQETWCRLLRARRGLKPDGNFPAYLTTIASNLWRDSQRSARRAGPMAENRMPSLNAPIGNDDGERLVLADALPDLNSHDTIEHRLLAMDIDQALGQIAPVLRTVLVARFLNGESCAEIGKRFGRTEQTISSWVRAAVRQIRIYLQEAKTVSEAVTL